MDIKQDVIAAIGNTPLIRLHKASELTGCDILGKAEFMNPGQSVKDRAGMQMILEAEKRGDPIVARDAHERFHFELYEASGSTWLVRCIWPVWRNCERYRAESMRNREHFAARAREHLDMLAALEAGDGEQAVQLIVLHLRSSMTLVAASLESTAKPTPGLWLPDAQALVRGFVDA